MYWDVVKIKPTENLSFAVWFADGLQGAVEIRPSHLYGVFEKLKDPVFCSGASRRGFCILARRNRLSTQCHA